MAIVYADDKAFESCSSDDKYSITDRIGMSASVNRSWYSDSEYEYAIDKLHEICENVHKMRESERPMARHSDEKSN